VGGIVDGKDGVEDGEGAAEKASVGQLLFLLLCFLLMFAMILAFVFLLRKRGARSYLSCGRVSAPFETVSIVIDGD